MKSLLFICIMGLISIFDCKVDDEKRDKVCVPILGPELIDQVRWCEVGLAWWPLHDVSWNGDGVKLIAVDGSSGSLEYAGLVNYGSLYKIRVSFVDINGWLEFPGWSPSKQWNVPGSFTYEWDAKCINAYGKVVIDHSGFTGSVLSFSVKEILGYNCN